MKDSRKPLSWFAIILIAIGLGIIGYCLSVFAHHAFNIHPE